MNHILFSKSDKVFNVNYWIFARSEVKVKVTGTWNLHLAHLLLLINIYAKYQVNQAEFEGGVCRTRLDLENKGQISRSEVTETWNLRLAHLLLLIKIYAKYQVNKVETEGGVWRTRFWRETDRRIDWQADSSIPPPNYACWGITTTFE